MANFSEILKHGGNYMIANIATRALAFISIPVYTRLLSTQDYGVISIFLGVAGIMNCIFTLNSDKSVSRYFYDQKDNDDFKRFVGTSSIFSSLIFLIIAIILIVFSKSFGRIANLQQNLVYLIIPIVFFNIVGLTFEQIYTSLKSSKLIAQSSLLRVYLGFGFSVLGILLMSSSKYFGQIYGQIFAGIIMCFFWVRYIRKYFTLSFDKKYLKYILNYSIPLIPDALSGVIIEQFGKIAIGTSINVSSAGYYSLAVSISSIVAMVVYVTTQAWIPYYFEYMNTKQYEQHDIEINKIFRITLLVAMSIASFGQEIGTVLAKKDFTSYLYLIPILVLGFVFYQFSYVYIRNISYAKKTIYISLVVLLSGIINVLLNVYLIPIFGEIGAAVSFVSSYLSMTIFAWLVNKYILKIYYTPVRIILKPLCIYILFMIPLYLIFNIKYIYISIFLKLFLLVILSTILFWSDRKNIILSVNRIVKR